MCFLKKHKVLTRYSKVNMVVSKVNSTDDWVAKNGVFINTVTGEYMTNSGRVCKYASDKTEDLSVKKLERPSKKAKTAKTSSVMSAEKEEDQKEVYTTNRVNQIKLMSVYETDLLKRGVVYYTESGKKLDVLELVKEEIARRSLLLLDDAEKMEKEMADDIARKKKRLEMEKECKETGVDFCDIVIKLPIPDQCLSLASQ